MIKCPLCDTRMLCIDSRHPWEENECKRRYHCPNCFTRVTTVERVIRKDLAARKVVNNENGSQKVK